MYRTGPPPAGLVPAHTAALRVRGAERLLADDAAPAAFDPTLLVGLADLVRPYGLAMRADLARAGTGRAYGDLAGPLVSALVPEDAPVDLIVLVFAIHDVRPERPLAIYLNHVTPGAPFGLTVCDQGAVGPFTALRLIREYGATGGCPRALMIVLEQSALHYEPAGPAMVPDRNAAVALRLELGAASGPDLGGVRLHPRVAAADVPGRLAAEVAAAAGGREDVTLILGGGLARLAGAGLASRVIQAPDGQPFTGPWWELAGGLPGWAAGGGLVVLAEYDPALGYLGLCTVDFAGAGEPVGAAAGILRVAP